MGHRRLRASRPARRDESVRRCAVGGQAAVRRWCVGRHRGRTPPGDLRLQPCRLVRQRSTRASRPVRRGIPLAPACLGRACLHRASWLDGSMPADTAFLLVSFAGPEGRDDVMPFLRNVTAGRGVPDRRLAEVAEHYYEFGGVSPINAQCRDLLAAIGQDFARSGIDLPLYWGNRNWTPYLADTMRAMAADGIKRAVALATSAYSSYSSCRQYLDNIDHAMAQAGPHAPAVIKIPPYYRHPGFIGSFTDAAARALASLPAGLAGDADLVFTGHSIPESMAPSSGPA